MTPPLRTKTSTSHAVVTAGDLAHSRTSTYRRRVDETRRILHELPDRTAAAISWGKDSIVLADLLQQERPDIPIIHLRGCGPERPPGLDETRDSAITRWDLHPHLPSWEPVEQIAPQTGLRLSRAHQGWTPAMCRETSPGTLAQRSRAQTGSTPRTAPGSRQTERPHRQYRHASDRPSPPVSQPARTCYLEVPIETPVHAWAEAKSIFAEPQTIEETTALRAVTSRNFARWRDAITKDLKATHVVGAMRARESKRRLLAIAQHGITWQPAKQRKWDIPTTHALAWWTSRDIWAHIAARDLPIPRHYRWAVQHGYSRDRVRSEPNFHPIAWDHSQAEFWSHAEPDMWRRFLAIVPGFHPDLLSGKRRTTRGTVTVPRLKRTQLRLDEERRHTPDPHPQHRVSSGAPSSPHIQALP